MPNGFAAMANHSVPKPARVASAACAVLQPWQITQFQNPTMVSTSLGCFAIVANHPVLKPMDRLSVFYQQFHGLRAM